MGKPTSVNISGLRGVQRAKELENLDLTRIVVLAVDPARDFPKALICNYFGTVLEKPFFFAVNSEGIMKVHKKLQYWVGCVKALRVFVGIEIAGCYHEAISEALTGLGYEVGLVNPYTTASHRKMMLDFSKTDDKDLLAIAQALITNNGVSVKRVTGFYEQLQVVCRARRQFVKEASAVKIQIRQLMSMVFREFQGLVDSESLTRQTVFGSFWSPKSKMVMSCFPLPSEILNLGETGLKELTASKGLKLSDRETTLLLQAAKRDLMISPAGLNRFNTEQIKFRLEQLQFLEAQIASLAQEMENMLIKTPAVLLLSIKGLGVVTATEFIAETGSIFNFTYNRQLVKLAGINPVMSQSGGKKTRAYKISRQGNPALRYIVTLIGKIICSKKCCNSYFIDYYERLSNKGKMPSQIYAAAGNKFLRIAFAMLKEQKLFHVPGYEQCTSDIYKKLKYQENRETARHRIALLTGAATEKTAVSL